MKRLAFLALILSGVFWGFGFPLGKLALREIDAGHMVLLRFVAAGLAAAPFAFASRASRALFRSPPVLAAGALYGIAFLIQFEGLARSTVTFAALMVGAMPAMIAVVGRLLGERVGRLTVVGVVAATLGAALIAGRPGTAASPLGVGLMVVSLLVFMAWLVVLRQAPAAPSRMAVPAVTVIVAAATILPLAFLLHGTPNLHLSPGAWAGIAGQGVFSTFLATAAWQFGASQVGSASAGVFINIEPLMGAAIGVAMFGDRLTPALAIGGLLILIGSFVVVLSETDAPPTDMAKTPPTPA